MSMPLQRSTARRVATIACDAAAGALHGLKLNGLSEPWSGTSETFSSSCQLMHV